MHSYISSLLTGGQNNENYAGSDKTYFSPWWKFWNRKIKSESSSSGDWRREFDEAGELLRVSRRRSVLHPRGVGSKYYWETLDLKTLIAVSQPYPYLTKKVFSDGRCEEIYEPQNGEPQKVVLGHVNNCGDNVPYANLFFKEGKRIKCQWVKKTIKNEAFWKRVIQAFDLSLEDKEALLEQAAKAFRKDKQIPKTEAELRSFKNEEEKARLKARKASVKKTITQEKYQEIVRRRQARR